MLSSLASRLPGVYFETVPSGAVEDLPRMDVAAFVGFASSGPLHLPVAVEGVSRFREIFGTTPGLAWSETQGATTEAALGPAVEAFFRQGGRRCWIVRVADESTAVTLRFPLDKVRDADVGSDAVVDARSPGAWAAALTLGTILNRERFPFAAGSAPLERVDGRWRLRLAQSPRTIRRGDLLEIVVRPGLVLFVFVGSVRVVDGALHVEEEFSYWFEAPAESPPGNDERFGADNPDLQALAPADVDDVQSPALVPTSVCRLTFEMLAWRGAHLEFRLADLAFSEAHPRFWASLPTDATLFEPIVGRKKPSLSLEEQRFRAEAATPRFPFAGPPHLPVASPPRFSVASPMPAGRRFLPIGMPTRPDPAAARSANNVAGRSALELDGLTTFDDRLFLDPDLTRFYSGALLGEAEQKHANHDGPPLRGIHALLPIADVCMVAVPDAIQRGWTRTPPPARPVLEAPWLDRPMFTGDRTVALDWNPVSTALRYRLQVDTCRNFSHPADVSVEEGQTAASYRSPDVCPVLLHFRVRAERRGQVSAWSNSRSIQVPHDEFGKCGATGAHRADLIVSSAPPVSPQGESGFEWRYEDPADAEANDRFQIQRAFEPTFDVSEPFEGDAEEMALGMVYPRVHRDVITFYRIRVVRNGERGSWSNTIALGPVERQAFTELPDGERSDALLAVQRALIRFCAARADMTALLSLPADFLGERVIEHLGDLLPQVSSRNAAISPTAGMLRIPALTSGEEDVLSYVSLYHPWVAVAQRGSTVWEPPDGYAAGMIAARTLRLGAWVAPANETLSGVIALRPAFSMDTWAAMTDIQINLVVAEARGFVVLNAETLSRRDDLRPLNVRRLLILLRRLALREGTTFVFEPNSEDFRALVRQRFDRVLSGLYLRGAFQGASPATAFRVVVDESVNPPRAVENGRLIVELRVAPSQSFRYLTVRLEQTAPEKLQVMEG